MATPNQAKGTKKADAVVASHMDGFNAALDDALKNTGWAKGSYENVQVQFSATVDITNPGSIVEYSVTLSSG